MLGRKRPHIESLLRDTVVVHTTGEDSLKGVLVGVYDDCLVLRHAVSLWDGGETTVDGDAVVPLERIAWLQRLGEAIP